MKIGLAQINPILGDIAGNSQIIAEYYHQAMQLGADLVVFPELAITGYPTDDLVLRDAFVEQAEQAVLELAELTKNQYTGLLIGLPILRNGKRYNAIQLLDHGKIIHEQTKYDLPNYGVFDEKRVFDQGTLPTCITYNDKKIGILICEEMWNKEVVENLENPDLIIAINASPFEHNKYKLRRERAKYAAKYHKCPLYYVNQLGGQDDLVFDGDSFVLNSKGIETRNLTAFTTGLLLQKQKSDYPPLEEAIFKAMSLALRDYVLKNNFKSVVIGLSGGIDSAISAVIAVDALGASNVKLVMMPSRFTSADSLNDAKKLADILGIDLENISIEPMLEAFENEMQLDGLAHENIQSRIRGNILMAISNSTGAMVLTTGNKSEIAVGYSTLYGDMCGGYNAIKDLYKTEIYQICSWLNRESEIIPRNIMFKAPSAELRDNQTDQDSLPDYQTLDKVLKLFIEEQKSVTEIIKSGIPEEIVNKTINLVYSSEYKRRQSAPGVKLSTMPFGRDRRYPVTNKFRV